ncbi:MAG: hypothetical protein D8M53_11770 [Armatimonadetes bacterium]|nr:hypothetical protein [Armatimonadota bacterium]
MSSLTTLDGLSTTSPAAIWLTVWASRRATLAGTSGCYRTGDGVPSGRFWVAPRGGVGVLSRSSERAVGPSASRRTFGMAKICQVSGKKGLKARHIRHRHSGQWKFRAPRKNRVQQPNLQVATVQTPHGRVRLVVSAKVLKSPEFAAVMAGLKPVPAAWLKKPTYT